jgi:hypothetical protein
MQAQKWVYLNNRGGFMEQQKSREKPETKKFKKDELILRAKDIIPGQISALNKKDHTIQKSSAESARSEPVEKKTVYNTAFSGDSVPTFDLAEEIMAEQRKITAAKRTAPGIKTKDTPKNPQADEQPETPPTQIEQIIAEIVAKDIAKTCKSG